MRHNLTWAERGPTHAERDLPSDVPRLREQSSIRSIEAPVSSHNEWDPLEEVVVGTLEGAAIPSWHVTLEATLPERHWSLFKERGGARFHPELVAAAQQDLDALARLLEAEGVRVHRPDAVDHARTFASPDWSAAGGVYAAMPRDCLMVVGDQLIEAPMGWRSRFWETAAFRPLLKQFFARGARWLSAPKPELKDELYNTDFDAADVEDPIVLNEVEPIFDAADFFRCGRDIFYFRSHTTNAFGASWLARQLGDAYRLHELPCDDRHRMHIDTTYVPLRPGLLMVNPERVRRVPDIFRGWDVVAAPPGATPDHAPLYFSSKWLNMNVLMLDEERVVVAAHEEPLIRGLREWGLKPLPCPFMSFYAFGGSIHCATLDVVRRGVLRSYF